MATSRTSWRQSSIRASYNRGCVREEKHVVTGTDRFVRVGVGSEAGVGSGRIRGLAAERGKSERIKKLNIAIATAEVYQDYQIDSLLEADLCREACNCSQTIDVVLLRRELKVGGSRVGGCSKRASSQPMRPEHKGAAKNS